MTKVRAALTFENALTKVAGHIGWPEVAKICGSAVNTVRNWSDPDTTARITLESALKLDVAFRAAGGDGAPFLLCYATLVDAASLAACPGVEALLASAARAAKESGEAIAAALNAAHPDADRADFAIAEREVEEALTELTNSLAALRARRKAVEDMQRGEDIVRVPEVTPPIAS